MPTGFTPVFPGTVIYPSDATFLALTMTADVTLMWPNQLQSDGLVAAAIVEATAAAGLSIILSDARQVTQGYTSLFNNIGSNTFSVKDQGGNTLMTVASGQQWELYLADNSTANGTWRVFQYGAGASSANAGALAGAGLKAITTTLNVKMLPLVKSADYPIVNGDRARIIQWEGGVGTLTLPNPATVGSDWFVGIKNAGTGTVAVAASSGNIDDAATLSLPPGESMYVYSDGTDMWSFGLGQAVNSVFDFVSIAIPGTGDYILSGAQLNRVSYRFTGVLTGNRNIIVPNTVQQYWVDNETTGAFTLTVKTAAGAGVLVPQTRRSILYSDGTDVVNAETLAVSTPVAINQGGTGEITAPAALLALGGVPLARLLTAGSGLTGGGDLSADRTFNVGAGTGITVNADDVALDTASTRNTDHAGVSIVAGSGLVGGGDITASRTLDIGAGTGITVNANDVALDTSSNRNVDHSAVSITGANSITGGGAITASQSLQLSGDAASPGNSQYYGTDGAGAKGFYPIPFGANAKFALGKIGSGGALIQAVNVDSSGRSGVGVYTIDYTSAGFTGVPYVVAVTTFGASGSAAWIDTFSVGIATCSFQVADFNGMAFDAAFDVIAIGS